MTNMPINPETVRALMAHMKWNEMDLTMALGNVAAIQLYRTCDEFLKVLPLIEAAKKWKAVHAEYRVKPRTTSCQMAVAESELADAVEALNAEEK